MHAVLTWEVSRREQSPGLNALLSMVAREQKNQLGEHLFVHQKAKKEAEAAEQGLPPWAVSGPGAAAPARLGGEGTAARWSRNPISPFPPFQSQGSEDPLRDAAS